MLFSTMFPAANPSYKASAVLFPSFLPLFQFSNFQFCNLNLQPNTPDYPLFFLLHKYPLTNLLSPSSLSLSRSSMAIGWFKKLNSRTVFQWPWTWSFSFFSSSPSPSPSGSSWRGLNLGFSLLDDLLFQILYCVEAVVLVFALCFFFLCCGCHI